MTTRTPKEPTTASERRQRSRNANAARRATPKKAPASAQPLPPEAARVYTLRRSGIAFSAIATELKITEAEAEALWERYIADMRLPYDVKMEVDRLDRLRAAIWGKAAAGDTDAIATLLAIDRRQEQLRRQPRTNDHLMRRSFDSSIQRARDEKVITALDEGLVAAGATISDRIDDALATGDGVEVTKALYLVPHMMNVLKEALATPASRVRAEFAASSDETTEAQDALNVIQGQFGKVGRAGGKKGG